MKLTDCEKMGTFIRVPCAMYLLRCCTVPGASVVVFLAPFILFRLYPRARQFWVVSSVSDIGVVETSD